MNGTRTTVTLVVEDTLPLEDADVRMRGCGGRRQARQSASRGWKTTSGVGKDSRSAAETSATAALLAADGGDLGLHWSERGSWRQGRAAAWLGDGAR
jgi:hypothetical protein